MAELNIDIVATGSSRDLQIQRVYRALTNEIVVMSVADMVQKITARLGAQDQIGRLRIFAHAAPGVLSLYPDACPAFQPNATIAYHPSLPLQVSNGGLLQQLKGRFAPRGWLELHSCGIGRGPSGESLLRGLANILGVTVKAGKVDQVSGGGLEGTSVIVRPGGMISYRQPS